jgi:carbonic anhydrase/acetyltransferase-like protein (isoleucine patch superfamily)
LNIFSLGERRVEFAGPDWYVAPTATLIGSVCLHAQANVWFNVVMRGDNERIVIGERTNVQDGSVLHVDPNKPLTLGTDTCVGHNVTLHGCTVGDGVLIGMGATLLNRCQIGSGSIVGAGALVPEDKVFPERVLLLGTPARVVREITDDEVAWIRRIAAGYVQRAAQYRTGLAPQPAPDGAGQWRA